MATSPIIRSRVARLLGIIFIIALGLGSRRFTLFPASFGKYPGNVLWALLVLVGLGFIFVTSHPAKLALVALLISYAVEFGKFYHGAWLEALRNSVLGHLVLGYAFSAANLLCYTIGVVLGFVIDVWSAHIHRTRPGSE